LRVYNLSGELRLREQRCARKDERDEVEDVGRESNHGYSP
jgi:hypothetical protein